MIPVLIMIPALVLISALVMYRFNGRRQLLNFDVVQFIYTFVIAPVLFVWLKSFLFVLVRTDLNDLGLTVGQFFAIDTAFSVLMMFIYAFVVIHGFVKSIDLKRHGDPLFDIFKHVDYFHFWLSHFVTFAGGLLLMTLISISNVISPMSFEQPRSTFYYILLAGFLTGLAIFTGIWNYKSPQPYFMRQMKVIIGLFFLVHVFAYYLRDPVFNINYGAYWFVFANFLAMIIMSLFAERPEKQRRLPYKISITKSKYYVQYLLGLTRKL